MTGVKIVRPDERMPKRLVLFDVRSVPLRSPPKKPADEQVGLVRRLPVNRLKPSKIFGSFGNILPRPTQSAALRFARLIAFSIV